MANFTITISNQLYALGPDAGTPSLWNTFQWGDKWQFTPTGLITETIKLVTNAVTPSDDYFLNTEKIIDNAVTPDDTESYFLDTIKGISNNLTVSPAISSETLSNGAWDYVFVKPSTNAVNRNPASFVTQSNAQTTWSSSTASSTSWS